MSWPCPASARTGGTSKGGPEQARHMLAVRMICQVGSTLATPRPAARIRTTAPRPSRRDSGRARPVIVPVPGPRAAPGRRREAADEEEGKREQATQHARLIARAFRDARGEVWGWGLGLALAKDLHCASPGSQSASQSPGSSVQPRSRSSPDLPARQANLNLPARKACRRHAPAPESQFRLFRATTWPTPR